EYLFVETIENVSSHLSVYDMDGKLIRQIKLPGMGSINALIAGSEPEELLISFSSFLIPRSLYRMDLETLEYTLEHQDEVPFDPAAFEVRQIWFESRDRTRIPMFVLHKKEIERDGGNPAVVHGYGGFGV